LVALRRKINIKLFLVVFPHIVLFKFEVKYKLGLKENLDMDPDPGPIKMKNLDPDPTRDPAGPESGPGLEGPAAL
jgi:hypothetical protein